jgi:inner membrane transporter RhtA
MRTFYPTTTHRTRPHVLAGPLRGLRSLSGVLQLLPPPMMVLLAMISVQFGAATAKSLFAPFGAPGVVFVRTGFAALILWLIARPQVRQYSRHQWSSAIVLGIVIAMMNLLFYESLVRLPLGVAVTIEFLGPLAVALLGSRKLRDLVWIVLAFGGVLLLAPIGDLTGLDPLGILFACGAATGWAAYILLTSRTSKLFTGTTGLALAMSAAALVTLPLGVISAGPALLSIPLLLKGVVVAMLSTTIPFSLEFLALKRIPPRTFGILMAAEPAIAVLAGLLLLSEHPTLRALVALVLVSAATIGVARSGASLSE